MFVLPLLSLPVPFSSSKYGDIINGGGREISRSGTHRFSNEEGEMESRKIFPSPTTALCTGKGLENFSRLTACIFYYLIETFVYSSFHYSSLMNFLSKFMRNNKRCWKLILPSWCRWVSRERYNAVGYGKEFGILMFFSPSFWEIYEHTLREFTNNLFRKIRVYTYVTWYGKRSSW